MPAAFDAEYGGCPGEKANDDRVLALDRGRRVWTAQVKPNGCEIDGYMYNMYDSPATNMQVLAGRTGLREAGWYACSCALKNAALSSRR